MPTGLSTDQWRRALSLLEQALGWPEETRDAFLASACGADEALREEVRSLLEADALAQGFLEEPAVASEASPLPRPSGPGDQVGPYRLLRELGEGGTGRVYLAERADGQFERQVAIKLIKSGFATEQILWRFRRERQILAGLDHPSIARLLDGGSTEAGQPYLVMEYVDGPAITEWADARRLPLEQRVRLFQRVCSAVHHAHRKLVLHRDLKPSNILVSSDAVPKLLDFGIAKLLSAESGEEEAQTATGVRLMTPFYASPEQIRGEPLTTASDVYSLGVILYELLTGHRPYAPSQLGPAQIERAICEVQPEPPSVALGRVEERTRDGETRRVTPEAVGALRQASPERLRRRLAGDLDTIVLQAMRKEPERRYASAEELARDLERHLQLMPVLARKDTLGYRAGKFVRRHAALVVAAGLVAASLIFGMVTTIHQARLARAQRDRAEVQQLRAELVSAFLVDLFGVSDPGEARGNTITAREVLDRGAGRIGRELRDQPEVQATLMETMGTVYRRLSLYDQASPLLERALELRRQRLGPEHPDVARSLDSLGALRREKSDYDAAERLLREGLALRQKTYGPKHPEVAASLGSLALVMRDRGDYAAAEALGRQALAMQRELLGGTHGAVAKSLDDLATVLQRRGRLDEAEVLYREALELRRTLVGADHPDVAESLDHVAFVLEGKGNLEAAEATYREALALQRRLYGEEHYAVADTLGNLASLLQQRAKHLEAERAYRDALVLFRKVLRDDDHPAITTQLHNLGLVLKDQGRYDEAEALVREVLARDRRRLGEKHPDNAYSLHSLAALLRAKAQYRESARVEREALDLARETLGDQHFAIATMLSGLSQSRSGQGALGEAEDLERQALALRRKRLGDEHPDVAFSLQRLGTLLHDRQQDRDAEASYREALRMRTKLLGEEHPDLADTLTGLAGTLIEGGRLAEAEPLLRRALGIDRKILPAGHPQTADALLGLGVLLAARGEAAAAEPLLREATEIRRRRLPAADWRVAEAESALGGVLLRLERVREAGPLLGRSQAALRAHYGEDHRAAGRARQRFALLCGRPGGRSLEVGCGA